MEWSQDKILFFIDLYRNKPIIWDPQDPQHYNKLKKHDAWQQLADELETTVEECKRKITSLLASLRREKSKVSKSKGTGKGAAEVYNSTWFAFKALAFVLDRNKPRPTMETIDTEIDDNAVEAVGATTNTPDEIGETARNANAFNDDKFGPPRSKKARKSAEEMMASAYTILKKASQKPETTTRPAISECESFGLFVSNKLKNYTRSTRNIVQHHFSNILFNADQGRYDSVCDRMAATYEYGYGQSHTLPSNSSPSTYPPTPSPQPSLQSLEGNEGYLSGTQEQSAGYMIASAISRPPRPYTSTPLHSPQSSSQDAHIQEEHINPEFDDEFSDLIN